MSLNNSSHTPKFIFPTTKTIVDHPNKSDRSSHRKHRCLCRSPWWTCWECCLVGLLLFALILSIFVSLWLTSSNSTQRNSSILITISTSSSLTWNSPTTSTTTISSCLTWMWNQTGETILGTTSTSGTGSNQLNNPWNLFIDQTNSILYIADSQNHRIQRFDLNGSSIATTIAGQTSLSGSSSLRLNVPRDIFVDSSKNLYVADSSNQRIQYFPNGNLNGQTISSSWTSVGQLWGVQVFNNFIYANDKVQSVLWRNGTNIIGNFVAGPLSHQLHGPQGFIIDTSILPGCIFIVNSQQHTVVQWPIGSTNGTIVAGINGSPGSSSTQLMYPVSMKLDSNANMFIVDNNNHRIQLYCRNSTTSSYGSGRTIVGKGTMGNDSSSLNYPAGIDLDSNGNLYVSDTSNHRIQKFRRLI